MDFRRVIRNNKGTLLVHVVVMAVVLALIGAMMLKWTLGRHIVVAKTKRGIKAKALMEACLAEQTKIWIDDPAKGPPNVNNGTCTQVEPGITVTWKINGEELTFDITDNDSAKL